MLFIYAMLLSFLIVGGELYYTARKSTEQAYFAFFSARIQSSQRTIINEKLQKLADANDLKSLKNYLVDQGIITGNERQISDLFSIESSINSSFEDRYNELVNYLTDDLKEFFEAYKLDWDIKNLKTLFRCVANSKSQKDCLMHLGPIGSIKKKTIEEFLDFQRPMKMLDKVKEILPTDISSKLFSEKFDLKNLEIALDHGFYDFMNQKTKEIKTNNVKSAWTFLNRLFEVDNIVIIARNKMSGSNENVDDLLLKSMGELDKDDYKNLLEAENYAEFLSVLRETFYKPFMMVENDIDPSVLKEKLKTGLYKATYERTATVDAEIIAHYMIGLQDQYKKTREIATRGLIEVVT